MLCRSLPVFSNMLAAAYATRSILPLASPLPTSLSVVAFHATSAVWYAARSPRIFSLRRSLTWSRNGTAHGARPGAATAQTILMFVASTAMQWPLSAPCAAALPFVACCLLGLETSIGSNVMLLSQTLLLVVAVVFDGALLLPLLTTAVALIGFGVAAGRADPLCFLLAAVAHMVFALLGAVALVNAPSAHASVSQARVDLLSACFCAVLCAEARVRAATSATPTRQRVLWACRAATLGCVPALTFRGLAEKKIIGTPHIATAALACVALCSPWFWHVHRAWRNKRVSPPALITGEALMLGVVFVGLLFTAFAIPTITYFK